MGSFTDWKPDEMYRMIYDRSRGLYIAEIELKQGYYNYTYALVSEDNPKEINYAEVEGSWHETENVYTVLIYWRPFGQRYDRVIGINHFNSVRGQ